MRDISKSTCGILLLTLLEVPCQYVAISILLSYSKSMLFNIVLVFVYLMNINNTTPPPVNCNLCFGN